MQKSYVVSAKQVEIAMQAQRAVEAAMQHTSLVVSAIMAGVEDLEEGGQLTGIDQSTSSFVFEYPDVAPPELTVENGGNESPS